MLVHPRHELIKIKRHVTILDGPVMDQAYSRAGKEFRVEHVAVEYVYMGEGWTIATVTAVDITGTIPKKDGTNSLNTHTRSPDHTDWDRVNGLTFKTEWLNEIIETLRPSGCPTMSYDNFEVKH